MRNGIVQWITWGHSLNVVEIKKRKQVATELFSPYTSSPVQLSPAFLASDLHTEQK